MRRLITLFLLVALLPLGLTAQDEVQVEIPSVVLTETGFDVSLQNPPTDRSVFQMRSGDRVWEGAVQEDGSVLFGEVMLPTSGNAVVEVLGDGSVIAQTETRAIPGWISILPPVLAIAIALIFQRVVPALFLGILFGAWAAVGFDLAGFWEGLLATAQVYVLGSISDVGHASIILFSLMIGGMVGIISRNGGMQGIVNKIVDWASTPVRGQVTTGLLGVGIFFDDYANTLVVGNTMRSVTDKLRISREKLAYIVDSTAAPIACLAFVTTWIGYEVGLIHTAVQQIEGLNLSAYGIFLNSIPYSFYPILALFFVFAVAYSHRDFGPMLTAEVRARTTGKVLADDARIDEAAAEGEELKPKAGKPQRAINAVLPVLVLVGGVLAFLYQTGLESAGPGASLREIIGEADSYKALVWASLLGVLTAAVLSIGQRILTVDETVDAWYSGLRAMLFAMIILVLAWSLSAVTETLHTADFLVSILGGAIPAGAVPAIVFVLAAATAFATGSSWGTMGILMPLVVPLSWAVLVENGMADPEHYHILFSTVSCVLAGAVWGDHCSPISDTTILSSMASGSDHIHHVRTQLPYALTVGGVAILLGTLPAGFGFPWWISLILGVAVLLGILYTFGTPVPDAVAEHNGETVKQPA